MPGKVFIEEHLEQYLKSLAQKQLFIPGIIIGQVSNSGKSLFNTYCVKLLRIFMYYMFELVHK